MRKKMIGALVLGVIAAAAIVHTDVLAQAPATPADAVKARQDLMKGLFPNHYRAFVQVARGESTDIASLPQKAQAASAEVRKIPSLFPPGSGKDAVPATRAKPEVWSQRAEFDAAVAKLAEETDKLGQIAARGNIDEVKTQVAAVNQACTACHGGPAKSGGKFRAEEP
jgi:cytochrome c556